jgi:capsular polysaccharide transport system permease protein
MNFNFSKQAKLISIITACAIPALYLGLVAEDRFETVSHFSVVVEESNNAEASMGFLDMVTGASAGATDAQVAIGFINSSDLLFGLEKEFGLIEHYTAPPVDFIFRLKRNPTKQDRLEYYGDKIFAQADPHSGLIHLTVQSFSPELSQKLSTYILNKTENFINNLNKDIATKRLSFAQDELDRAQDTIKQNERAFLEFQNKYKVIQPEAIIQAQMEAIQTLRLEKIRKGIELATLEASSPDSPMRASLGNAIDNLEREIKNQEAALSGPEAQKLNQILAHYKELQLNLELSLNLRKGAELILEKTRAEAIATSRFFSVIQNPYLSDDNTHPRRLYLSITSAIVILLALYIIKAIIASVYDRV